MDEDSAAQSRIRSRSRPARDRHKSIPRGRRSAQTSATRREETPSLTSFEPFNSSPIRSNGREPSRGDSCSSGKRSRSFFAPNRLNSTDGEHFETSTIATATTDERSPSAQPARNDASKAAQSLMNTMMENERTADSLFTEHDMQYFRQHPSALANIDNASLRGLSRSHSYFDMIRTLGGDLAQRDAEMVALRRRIEELGKVFKDHLCHAHDLTRLDADRTVQGLTTASRYAADHSLDQSLDDAAETALVDQPQDPLTGLPSEEVVSETSTSPVPESSKPAPAEIKGMLAVFGGRGTVKAPKANRKKEVPLLQQVAAAKPPPSMQRRKSSIGSESSRSLVAVPAGPVEMNAIVETEDLPPPLISQRDIRAYYPGYSADCFGFVIDASRINRFLEGNRTQSPFPRSRGADTPLTSSSSVRSLPPDSDPETETPPETEAAEGSSWVSYLKFDTSTLGSLSWLPIASASGPSADYDEEPDLPIDMEQSEAIKVLQQRLADDFHRLQKSRLIPWEKFLSADRSRSDSTSYMPAMFRRSQPATKQSAPDMTPQLASLPASLRAERIRLVVNGIPMSLRAQIYTSIALETLQPAPDEYANLVAASATSVDPALRAEVEDDVPRTLPNNVFFRPPASMDDQSPSGPARDSKGRSALRELLLAFLTRRPEIGYCQGMNLIAGYLLLCLPSTQDAFWVFVYLIEHPLADIYFDGTLRGATIEICVLRSFIDELVPRLGRKLAAEAVEPRESAPYNWFLTAFASALGVEAVYRVWDVLLGLPPPASSAASSTGFLIRLGVGLCKAFEEEMLALDSGFEVRGFMDRMAVGGVQAVLRRKGGRGIGIDGLLKASWKLGGVVRDEEIRRRRKFFALRVDEAP